MQNNKNDTSHIASPNQKSTANNTIAIPPSVTAVNPLSSLGNSLINQEEQTSSSRSKEANQQPIQILGSFPPNDTNLQRTESSKSDQYQKHLRQQSLSISQPLEQEESPFAEYFDPDRQNTLDYSVPTTSGTPVHPHTTTSRSRQDHHPGFVNSPLLSPERSISDNPTTAKEKRIHKQGLPKAMADNLTDSSKTRKNREHLRPVQLSSNTEVPEETQKSTVNRNSPSSVPPPLGSPPTVPGFQQNTSNDQQNNSNRNRRGSVSREATNDLGMGEPQTPRTAAKNEGTMRIDILDNEKNRARDYPNNSICTSKYTIVSFIPLNLFEQFRRISNFYFLVVMVLTLIPGASPVEPFSAIAPLALVVGVAAVKDAYEDYKRHRSDGKANSMPAHVLRGGEFMEIPSEDVQVGDVLKIYHGEEIRADCVLLASSLPEGLAYIETANLDGETNAKTKKSLDATFLNLSTVEQLLQRCNVTEPPTMTIPEKVITSMRSVPSQFVAGAKSAVNTLAEGIGLQRLPEDDSEMRRKRADAEDAHAPTYFNNNSFNAGFPTEETTTPTAAAAAEPKGESGIKRNPTTGPLSPYPDTPQRNYPPMNRSQTFVGTSETLKAEASADEAGIEMMPPTKTASNLTTSFCAPSGKPGVRIIATLPDPNLAHWQGVLKMGPNDSHALGLDNFLFRGAILRNTEWALAAVVYSGVETKMFLNLKQKPPKRSQFDRQMNVLMLAMFIISIALCIAFASAAVVFHKDEHYWYAHPGIYRRDSGAIWGWRFITHFILLSYLIPISLFITLELNKGFQVLFISMDGLMAEYNSDLDEWRMCRPKTSNLTSQLARVKYIFADKTGTLTENCMKFVGGHVDNLLFRTNDKVPIGCCNDAAMAAATKANAANNQNLTEVELPQPQNDNDSVLVRSNDGIPDPTIYSAPSGNPSLNPHQRPDSALSANIQSDSRLPTTATPPISAAMVTMNSPERSNDYIADIDRRNSSAIADSGPKMRDVLGADALGWELIRCGFEPSSAFIRKKKREELEQNRIELFAGLAQAKDKKLAKKLSLRELARRGSLQPSPSHAASHSHIAHSRFASMLGVQNASSNLFHGSAHREWPPHVSHSRTTSQVKRTESGADPSNFGMPSGPSSPFNFNEHNRSESNHVSLGNYYPPRGGGGGGVSGSGGHFIGGVGGGQSSLIVGDSGGAITAFAPFQHGRVVSMGGESQGSQTSVTPARAQVLERSSLFLYLLSLSACHSVVCFDPKGHPNSVKSGSPRSASRANSPMGSMILSNGAADLGISHSKATAAATSTSLPLKPIKLRKIYEGQSLDEVALVQAAADNFFELVERSSKEMTIEIMGRCYTYDIIAELEFTPQRKLMSIILKRNKSKDHQAHQRRRSYIAHSRSMASMDFGNRHSRVPSRLPKLVPSQSMASLHSHHRRSVTGQQRGMQNSHAQFGSFKKMTSSHHPPKEHDNDENGSQHHNSNPSSFPDYHQPDHHPQPHQHLSTQIFRKPQPQVEGDPLNQTEGGTAAVPPPPLNNDTFTPALINVVSNSGHQPITDSADDIRNVSSGAIGSGSPNGVSALLHFDELTGRSLGATTTPSASLTNAAGNANAAAANLLFPGPLQPTTNSTPSEGGLNGSGHHNGSSGTYTNGGNVYYHFPNHQHVFNNDETTSLRILDETEDNVYPYLMLTKGADSSMLPIIDMSVQTNIDMSPLVEESLNKMASTGLRTLVLGYRKLTQQDVDEFLPILKSAHQCMGDRNKALHEAYAHIEKKVSLIGATAVEDKLQDGVPETINFFLRGKVVVWMLTGDKRETAVTIAGTSGIIDPVNTEEVIHIDVTSVPDEIKISAVCEQMRRAKVIIDKQPPNTVVLVIDGVSLNAALQADVFAGDITGSSLEESTGSQGVFPETFSPSTQQVNRNDCNFFELGSKCRAAVCCRMTPLQKADIVRMFQTTTGHVALAIGDGANDVSMIQEAEIGIGIMGLEGAQAELAADFAIPKFRFLKRLMVVHGRHNLYRDSQTVLYSIYKCVVIVIALSFYTSKSAYSGQAAFNSWFLSMYNSFYCQIQALAIGIFDKDLPDEVLETNPHLYTELAVNKSYFNPREWVFNIIEAALLGIFVSLAALTSLHTNDLSHDHSVSLPDGASIWFIVIIFIMDTAATLRFLRSWTPLTIGVMIFGYAVLLGFTFALSSILNFSGSTELADVAWKIFGVFSLYSHVFLGVFGFFTCVTLLKYYVIDELLFPSSNATKVVEQVIGKHTKTIKKVRRAEKQRLRNAAEAAALLAAKDIFEAQQEAELEHEGIELAAEEREDNHQTTGPAVDSSNVQASA